MIFKRLLTVLLSIFILNVPSIEARDLIFEFKSGAFLPTDHNYREIYGTASVFYNPEFTVQLVEEKPWYIFFSVAYTSKEGKSIGFCTRTKVEILPLGIGVKYVIPFRYGNFYVGLGWQPTYLRTFNCSESVQNYTAKWGQGGIGKLGVYFDLPRDFRFDIFADYSFVHVGSCSKNPCCNVTKFVVPIKATVSGALLGVGIGYCF